MAAKKNISKPNIPAAPLPKTYKCSKCGLEEQTNPKKYFYHAASHIYDRNDHYMTICKTCCNEMFRDYYNEYGNELKAIRRMCMLLDLYYDSKIIDSANKMNIINGSLFAAYMSNVNKVTYKNKTFDTSLRAEDLVIYTKADIEKANEDEVVLAEKTVEFFGAGFTESEYKYLQDEYNEWVARYECSTKAQEELFKILSIMQLKIRKASASGIQKDLDSATKSFQDVLGTANLQPKQARNNAMVEANTLGTLIEKWENEDPIPEPDPQFQDVDGIRKYVGTWFHGHFCKMLGVKNDTAEEYEREKAKYTVKPPEKNIDEEEASTVISDVLKAAMEAGE